MYFIESTGVACSDSVGHNRVQVLSIPVLFSQLQSGLKLQLPDDCLGNQRYNRYAMFRQFRMNFWDL